MLDCDWCPVCSRAIPPEQFTVTVDNRVSPPPIAPSNPKTTPTVTKNAKVNQSKPAPHRAQTAKAGARRAAMRAQHRDKEIAAAAAAVVAEEDPVEETPSEQPAPSNPSKQRTVISQEPSPLYCSQKCKMEDEAKSNAFLGWDWHTYDDSGDTEHSNPPTLTTASTDSVPSLASPSASNSDHHQQPAYLQRSTTSPLPQQQIPLHPGSAPATISAPIMHCSPPLHYGGVSTLDLYAVGYPLAFNPGQQRMSHAGPHERLNHHHQHQHHLTERSSSATAQRRNRLRQEGLSWDQITPTQSLLIPSAPASLRSGGYDDVERRRRNHRSGSSSSSRSRSRISKPQTRRQLSQDSEDDHSHSNRDDTDDDTNHPTGLIMRSSVPVSVPGSLGSSRRSQSNHSGRLLSSSPLRVSSVSSKRQSITSVSKLGTYSHIPEGQACPSVGVAISRSPLPGTSRSISNAEANGWVRGSTSSGPRSASSRPPSVSPRDSPSHLSSMEGIHQEFERSGRPTDVKGHRQRRSRANLSFTTMDTESSHPPDSTSSTSSSYSATNGLSHAQTISMSSSTATIAALLRQPLSSATTEAKESTSAPEVANGTATSSPESTKKKASPGAAIQQQSKRNGSFAALASFFGFGGFGGLTMTSSNNGSGESSPGSGVEIKTKSPKSNVGGLVRPRSSSNASVAKLDVSGEINVPKGGIASSLILKTGDSSDGDQRSGSLQHSRSVGSQDPRPGESSVEMGKPFEGLDDSHMPRAKKPLRPLMLHDPVTGAGTEPKKPKVSPTHGTEPASKPKSSSGRRHRRTHTGESHADSRSKSPSRTAVESTGKRSAWDPDLVMGLKASRRLSEMSSKSGNGAYPNPFHGSPPLPSPTMTAASSASHVSHRSNHPRSHSHSRPPSIAPPDSAGLVPLPRSKSNHSITSMTSSTGGRQHRHSMYGPGVAPHAPQPPSPGGNTGRNKPPGGGTHLPRGLSMTSLSQAAYPHSSNRGGMYGPLGPPSHHPAAPNPPSGLSRTTSQPYVSRWFSTSPSAGGSAFGSPGGGGGGGMYPGYYTPQHVTESAAPYANEDGVRPPVVNGFSVPAAVAVARKKEEMKAVMPTYALLNLPTGTRKKMVWTKKILPDGTEEDVQVEGEEDEQVYEPRKRLFYFDR